MSGQQPQKPAKRFSVDYILWRIASLDHQQITDEEVTYFRENPDQIDEVSSPLTLHKLFLWVGLGLGVVLVALSKIFAHANLLEFAHPGVKEFVIDVVFEIGVALIGAAIVTFMISISLNQQQERAKRWRREIRKRIAERD
ncbi:MAG: hypothetical protein AAFR16_05515 [Pseudomonadota bacterium]